MSKKENKNLSRRYKVLGGLILLFSFITQNFLYDKWNAESQLLDSSAVDQAIIDKSILLNEALFFTASPGEGSFDAKELKNVKEQYIREAARKTALSHTVRILIANTS
jgi:hypothetical protein